MYKVKQNEKKKRKAKTIPKRKIKRRKENHNQH